MKKRTVSLISAALLFLYSAFSVSAVSYSETAEKETAVARHLLNSPVPSVGSIGGEWMVIGLARSGKISKEFSDGYYSNAESYVKTVGSNKLHRSKSTENSRMIIALTAIGKDPRDIAGYNLLTPLADFNFVKKQGINGPVWALIALDTMQYAYTQVVNLSGLKENVVQNISFRRMKGVEYEPNRAEMTVYVGYYAEKTVEVPIIGLNFPGDKELRTFPSRAKVTFRVESGQYQRITADNFVLAITYEELLQNPSDKYRLHLKSLPEGVTNARISPREVDYLIEMSEVEGENQ